MMISVWVILFTEAWLIMTLCLECIMEMELSLSQLMRLSQLYHVRNERYGKGKGRTVQTVETL